MSLQPRLKIHFDDWLAAERAATQGRSEYVDGEIFAMAGGTEAHNLIAGNVFAALHNGFKGRPCYVYTSDMKVRVESPNLGAYPDAVADSIALTPIEVEIPLAEVYDKVEFVPRAEGMGGPRLPLSKSPPD